MSTHNGSFYDTVEGHKPNPSSIQNRESTGPWTNPNVNAIDTAGEARVYQARIERLAAEAADVTVTPGRRYAAKAEHDSLVKGLSYQVAQWRAIDEARAKNGGR